LAGVVENLVSCDEIGFNANFAVWLNISFKRIDVKGDDFSRRAKSKTSKPTAGNGQRTEFTGELPQQNTVVFVLQILAQ